MPIAMKGSLSWLEILSKLWYVILKKCLFYPLDLRHIPVERNTSLDTSGRFVGKNGGHLIFLIFSYLL